MDLLLYECNSIQHYTTIKRFSRLVRSQLINHKCATYCCKKCLHVCSTPELIEAHVTDCCYAQGTKILEDSRCRFTNVQKQLPAPFVVYADFESILRRCRCYTMCRYWYIVFVSRFQEHTPCNVVYRIVSNVDPDLSRSLVMYKGEDAAEEVI